MQIIHNLDDFSAPWEESVITLGVFDGMHRGHQALMNRLQKRSQKGKRARVLVTYDPHPDLVLGKSKTHPPGEIFTYQEKLSLLQVFDLDAVVFLPFTPQFARMTALRYLREVILGKLKAKRIIIGYDQTFGRGRKGDFAFLKLMSRKYDYSVERIRAIRYRNRVVSSSLIRTFLREGNVKGAGRFLGFDYFVTGTVVRGNRRGTVMGFPTANLEVKESKILPAEGVYGGYVLLGRRVIRAMVNVGRNPTFAQGYLTVEAHLLDFNENLYGEQIRLYFRERIRDEIRFSSVEELVRRLELDKKRVLRLKLPTRLLPGIHT